MNEAEELRAKEHGRLLREWMADKGLNAPALSRTVGQSGEKIGADYIRKLTRGDSELAAVSLPLREAIRKALRVKALVWEQKTGLTTGADIDPDEFDPPGFPSPVYEDEIEIDPALIEAARLFGDMPGFSGIRSQRLQRALSDIDFRDRPSTPEEWLAKYIKFKDELPNGDSDA